MGTISPSGVHVAYVGAYNLLFLKLKYASQYRTKYNTCLTNKISHNFLGPDGYLSPCLVFTPDSSKLIVASSYGKIFVFGTFSGIVLWESFFSVSIFRNEEEITIYRISSTVSCLNITHDGLWLSICNRFRIFFLRLSTTSVVQ